MVTSLIFLLLLALEPTAVVQNVRTAPYAPSNHKPYVLVWVTDETEDENVYEITLAYTAVNGEQKQATQIVRRNSGALTLAYFPLEIVQGEATARGRKFGEVY